VNGRRLLIAAAITVAAALLAGTATAARLTKTEYLAKLRTADTLSSKADNAALATLQTKQTTAAQVRAAFYAMGETHVRIGMEFAAIAPPRAATKANGDFAHAEIVLGRQNEAIALRLPKTKQAIMKYLQSLKPPSGGKLLDKAIAELHAAGFNAH
jgi:hypothetical protein